MDKSFLHSIRSSDDVDAIVSRLKSIKDDIEQAQLAVAADPETTEKASDTTTSNSQPDLAQSVDETANSVTMLIRTLRQLELLVDTFQARADRDIPVFKRYIDNLIYSYKTAYDATENFDKDWFSKQMFSEAGKIDIASYLLAAITAYCKDNLETLTMISNGDIDLLSYIRLPRQRSKT